MIHSGATSTPSRKRHHILVAALHWQSSRSGHLKPLKVHKSRLHTMAGQKQSNTVDRLCELGLFFHILSMIVFVNWVYSFHASQMKLHFDQLKRKGILLPAQSNPFSGCLGGNSFSLLKPRLWLNLAAPGRFPGHRTTGHDMDLQGITYQKGDQMGSRRF